MSEATKAVFLSYASQDSEAARRIADALRAAGVEVWFDQSELRGGDSWDRAIREQIKTCALFIPIISANTQTRGEGYFRLEWKLADRRTDLLGKAKAFLVPICIDDTTDAEADVPDSFLAVQWMRLRDGAMDAASVDRIATLLQGDVARPSGTTMSSHRPRETSPVAVSGANRGRWMLLTAALAIVILGVAHFWRPWSGGDVSPSVAAPAGAPLSEARALAMRAKKMTFAAVPTPGSMEAAERLSEQALALDGTDADVWAIAAEVDAYAVFLHFDTSEKRKDRARRRSDQAINLAPGSFEARFARAMVYVHVLADDSLKKDAEVIMRQLERERPTDKSLLYQIGLILRESGRFKEAAGYYERLGDDQGAGWNYAIAGMIDEAEAAADRALQQDHPADYAFVLKALLLISGREDPEGAYATLQRLPASSRLEDQLASVTAKYSLYRRKPEDVLATMKASPADILTTRDGPVPRSAITAQAHEMAGRTNAAMADYRVALAQIEKFLADRPTDIYLLLSKAEIQAALGDTQAAEATAKLATELSGKDPREVSQQNARLFMRLGRKEEVLAWLETELRLGNTSIDGSYHWVARFDPAFDPLRGDPRFEKLLRETLPKGAKPFDDQKTVDTGVKTAQQQPDPKSIAVLPFANMSEEKENAFFADGVQEDILTNLSNIHELRVVSRTSVMGYRGTTKALPQIALELGVTYILEGSVRRAGNKVRVTGQLIRAATDEHIWAKSFDRDLTDIFAIQSEVAQAIATALQAVISPQEKSLIEQKPTDNIAAYDAYTKARQILSAGAQQNFNDLVPLLKTAVLLDPKFAQAWAELGSVYARRYFDYWERTQEVLDNARDAIDKAVALAPDDPVVIQKLGDYYYYGLRDYPRAARQYRLLAEQYPNYAPAQASLAFIDRRMGRWGEAVEGLRRAVKLEPRNLRFTSALIETYTELRRYEEAETLQRQVVAQGGGGIYQKFLLAIIAFEKDGSTNEFDRMAEAFAADPKQAQYVLLLRYRVSRMKGDLESSIQATGQVREMQGPERFPWEEECNYAMALKIHGDTEQARALVEARIREERDKVEKQPLPREWMTLSVAYAVLDNKAEALRCAQAAIDLVPEAADATEGVTYTARRAMVLAWFGEKDEALAEVERLLGVPGGLRVEQLRRDPFWKPLQGDPRFEALLNDPKNNAPLL